MISLNELVNRISQLETTLMMLDMNEHFQLQYPRVVIETQLNTLKWVRDWKNE